jgi:hypothetical protein
MPFLLERFIIVSAIFLVFHENFSLLTTVCTKHKKAGNNDMVVTQKMCGASE